MSQAEFAAKVGLSKAGLAKRLETARRLRDEAAELEPEQDRPEIGDDDAEWLEIVDAVPAFTTNGYYALGTKEEQLTSGQGDYTCRDGTADFVFVGTGRGGTPRRNRLGTGKHVDTGQSYRPKDDGLKGGK